MLLQLPALPRRRQDHHERALSELHMPQSNADVLPEGLPVHKGDRARLHGGEASGSVLPGDHMPGSAGPTADIDDERAGDLGLHRARLPR